LALSKNRRFNERHQKTINFISLPKLQSAMSFVRFLLSKVFIKQLLLAVGILIILVFVILWWLKSTTNHDQRITVPDLKGMTLDVVKQELDALDLSLKLQDSSNYNPDYPKFSVLEQNPAPGKLVKEGRKIYLVTNASGYPKLPIPDIVGKTKREAEPTLKAVGFKIGKITYTPHIAKDEVREIRYKGQKIQPGTKLQKTSVIDLVLGDGKRDFLRNESTEPPAKEDTNDGN